MRKYVLILFSILLFFNPLVYVPGLFDPDYLPQKFFFEFILYCLIGIRAMDFLKRNKHQVLITPLFFPGVIYLAWYGIFLLLSNQNIFLSLDRYFLQVEFFIFFNLTVYLSAREEKIILAVGAFILGSLIFLIRQTNLWQISLAILFCFLLGLFMGIPFRKNKWQAAKGKKCFWIKEFNFSLRYFHGVPGVKIFFPLTIIIILSALSFRSVKPLVGSAYHLKAYYLMEKEEYSKVIPVINQAIWWDRSNGDLYRILGAAHHYLGEFAPAFIAYQKSFFLKPDFRILYNLGMINLGLSNDLDAQKYFLETIKLNPEMPEAYFELAGIYNRQGDTEKSTEFYAKGVEYQKKKGYNAKISGRR